MTQKIVETERLTKRYGAVTALDDCHLTIRRGEIFGLLGPNGAGKSTLLRLLLGYLRPTHGRARIDGLDCYRESVAVHARVAYLPGDVRLFHTMTGYDVLAFFGRLRDRGYTERANSLAKRLDLQLAPRTTAMSTGMRQKLGLVAVLAVDAPTVILDEPTANLDPTVRKEVGALVREAQIAGKTVVFSSHVLEEVERLCDRVAILRRGQLVHEQSLSTLRRQHRIRAQLRGPIPPVPTELFDGMSIETSGHALTIVTAGELSPLLAWLATLPLSDVRIEPVGLGAVYEQFHAGVPAKRKNRPERKRERKHESTESSGSRRAPEFVVSRGVVGESPRRSAVTSGRRDDRDHCIRNHLRLVDEPGRSRGPGNVSQSAAGDVRARGGCAVPFDGDAGGAAGHDLCRSCDGLRRGFVVHCPRLRLYQRRDWRGTMELLLAQPVHRFAIVVVQAVVTTGGSALIAFSTWLGIWLGMQITGFAAQIEPTRFMPSAMNLFGFMFFLAAFSTLISALGRDRRRAVGLTAGFYLAQVLMKIVAQAAPTFGWLRYGTFLGAFEPQSLAIYPETAWAELAWRNGCLIGLGIAAYAAAVAVFCRRDLPAPL